MAKMLAAVLHDFNDIRVEEVTRPTATEFGHVVVRIHSCGICASDFKAITGTRRNVTFPFIPGHEPSGVVVEIGPGVTNVKPGDEVICQPSGFCGFCRNCRSGLHHYCENAFTTGGDGPVDVWPGAFAEYMLTKDTCLFHKPPTISFDAAALTEPLSGCWKGLIQYSELKVGEDVVIIGAGSMGLLAVMLAHAAGAARLVVIDTSPFARQKALELGATHAIDPRMEDIKQRVYEILPSGPDLVFEAAGPIEAVQTMIDLRRRGTRWNVFGITTHEKFELDGGLTHFLEGRMDASFGTNPLAMSWSIRLMETGLVNPERVITHRLPLTKFDEAMRIMAGTDRTKVIIHP
jgi:threonine dehydrogenase-like Zn-dependent dehydrogenase